MNIFTCLSCRVVFADADLQREHYKSEWHRYNLKRKVAELPPVTAENFQQRIQLQKNQAEADPEPEQAYCELCSKNFKQKNTYNNHLQSKKHVELQAKLEKKQQIDEEKRIEKGLSESDMVITNNAKNNAINASSNVSSLKIKDIAMSDETNIEPDDDEGSVESWSGDALGMEECLFCCLVNQNLEDNLTHMSKTHCFFVPDIEFVCDLEGLMTYLGQKVGEGKICLWCNERGRAFNTVKSVQQHMTDKGHTKLLHEGDAAFEYADFYDYRSSYPDFTPSNTDIATTSTNIADDEEDEEVADINNYLMEDYQLVLPSGATIGHRSLQRYYRQSLNPRRDIAINPAHRVIAQYRGLGWTGTTGKSAEKIRKDMHFVQRIRARANMKMGMKNNKILQTHYRPQVIF